MLVGGELFRAHKPRNPAAVVAVGHPFKIGVKTKNLARASKIDVVLSAAVSPHGNTSNNKVNVKPLSSSPLRRAPSLAMAGIADAGLATTVQMWRSGTETAPSRPLPFPPAPLSYALPRLPCRHSSNSSKI